MKLPSTITGMRKVHLCHWLPDVGKTRQGRIQVNVLVLVAGVKISNEVPTTLSDCEASESL